MPHLPALVHADLMRTGPVRARTVRDRAHVAAMVRTRRAAREVSALLERDA